MPNAAATSSSFHVQIAPIHLGRTPAARAHHRVNQAVFAAPLGHGRVSIIVERELFKPSSKGLLDLSVDHVFADRQAVRTRKNEPRDIGNNRPTFFLGLDFLQDRPTAVR
jgi:hypothetical protein